MRKFLFGWKPLSTDFGLLVLRLVVGFSMAFGHGWGKMINFSTKSGGFPEVFGLPSEVSLGLAVFAEFFCSLLLALGIATRFTLIPLIITMAVAVFDIHIDDSFGKMEKALLYLMAYLTLFFTGPGKFSVDRISGK